MPKPRLLLGALWITRAAEAAAASGHGLRVWPLVSADC
jgi:hypothetical protein